MRDYLLKRFDDLNVTTPNVEDHAYILERANQLLEGIYVFDKTWDMEPCKIPYQASDIEWNEIHNDDEEWVFVRSRMDFLSHLIQAYQVTQDRVYLLRAKELMLAWIDAHPTIEYSLSTRTLDTGIRVSAWMDALTYLIGYDAINNEELELVESSIKAQIIYMKESYLPKYQMSNWGSIQVCIMLRVIPMLSDDSLKEIEEWANKELLKQLEIQIYDDGIFWEQSTMYQVEVMMYLMKYFAEEKRVGRRSAAIVETQLRKMLDTLSYLTTPLHVIESFGDSDRIDTRSMFTSASIVLDTTDYLSYSFEKLDSDTMYEYGYQPFTNKESGLHKEFYFDGDQSGLYVVNEENSYLLFTNGSLGSGHGHCDNLHYSYFFQGKGILIDGGRFTYRDDHPARVALKSMKAHQSIIVDNTPHSVPKDSWSNERFCIPLANVSYHEEDIHFIQGGLHSTEGLLHRRSLVQASSDILVVFDDLTMQGEHNYTHYLNFDPEVTLEYNSNDDITIRNGDIQLKMYTSSDISEIVEDECSLCYNELENRFTMKQTDTFIDSKCITTMFVKEGIHVEKIDCIQNGSKIADEKLAVAYKIHINEEESYTIAHVSHEIYSGGKVLEVDGTVFHAKDILIHRKGEFKKSYRLRV